MADMQTQQHYEKQFSFEFFPPKSERGVENLISVRDELAQRRPRFFSVTYGAGGSTRERTFQTVSQITRDTGIPAAPHLSCVGSSKEQIAEILDEYRAQGITHLVALRGDLPSGSRDLGDLRYASELVSFIREHSGDHFFIEVAAYPEFHPQAPSASADLANFARKVRAGANSAITQYFFNADAYFRFVDACEARQLDIPIVPGIMPITNFTQIARFSDACGAEIPRWLRWKLGELGDDIEAVTQVATDFLTDMCQRLLDAGAPGLHFYTMNRAQPTLTLWDNLGL